MMNHMGNFRGIFHRAFPVLLPDEPIKFMTADVKNVADIDRLIYQKWLSKSESSVFTFGEQAFGYGNGMEKFAEEGFSETQLVLRESPQLAAGLILEGLIDEARQKGRHYFAIYRNCCKIVPDGNFTYRNGYLIKTGYDLRAVYWNEHDPFSGEVLPVFGLVIEPAWMIDRGDPGFRPVSGQSGRSDLELLKIHGVERAEDYVEAFVESHREFDLPCGGVARLVDRPVTVLSEVIE